MAQAVFKIRNKKIYFTELLSWDVLNESKDIISGEDYDNILSHYIGPHVALEFSKLVDGEEEQIHFNATVNRKNGEMVLLSIFGYQIQSEDGVEVFGIISDDREANNQLMKALKELSDIKYALDQSVILAITDRQGKIIHANNLFSEISGYSHDELIGNTHQLINSGYHSREFFKEMWRTIGFGGVWKGEIRNRAKDGSFYWVDTTIVPVKNEKGKPVQYIAMRYDITDKKENQEKIRMMAFYDHLTGLKNRRKFDENLIQKIAYAKENQERFGIMFVDLDGFKYVNDTLGHIIGDELLIAVARRLEEIVSKNGVVARLSGDEFAILIDFITSPRDMQRYAESIITNFKEPFAIEGYQLSTTASIGISTYPEAGSDAPTMMKHADLAMYRVKGLSKNDYRFFDREMRISNQRAFQIKNDLRIGLDNNQFYLVYQPKVSPGKKDIVTSYEALIRWQHPEFQEVSPGEFIPLAEELGMINEIGDWVLENVCRQLKAWKTNGYDLLPVSINLSSSQFLQADFVDKFWSVLHAYQVDPAWIQIEITESLFIDNEKYVQQILKIMKENGIKIALDDFGTGYSSLAYLQKLDLDILKIDRSLISGISHLSIKRKIATTIVQLGKSMGMKVVAEGVETKEELDILRNHDIDEIQGYYYSKPLAIQEMSEVLKTKKLGKS
ncbi:MULTISPECIES: putative bifunctional diguanylate cyclase/phosphodiesterase [Oceanobacillus]|uniref:Bifunctional diguanylate cyclase/phosphodiesterase n=1 Tax=Oceanobacillus aidingensis TaxID=645964 RepID=A0ABV9JWG4_9BACI|nr:EAL domain-containing protein [Oceanobacillus oncorhynchi]MDM8102018.1 EAL domain-containing protein [Oceanobacillus oncorhynchi]